jgi:hypothetical protein
MVVSTGAILSGPVAAALVSRVAPQPAWSGVDVFAASFKPLQTLPYVLGLALLAGFVLFTASCHALARDEQRARTSAALVFTGIYAALVFTNYTIQIGYIPRIVHERPPFLASLTMTNPSSFAWFLEMFGYAAMGVATWLLARGFGGSRRGDAIRSLLVANGVLSVVGAACTALFDGWVFSTAGLVSFAAWNTLIPACFFLVATAPDGGHAR